MGEHTGKEEVKPLPALKVRRAVQDEGAVSGVCNPRLLFEARESARSSPVSMATISGSTTQAFAHVVCLNNY